MDNINRYFGVYRGIVKSRKDPLNKRRIQVTVPQTTGEQVTNWAWPLEPAHTHNEVPPVGQGVWIMYQGGDPDYPLWFGSFGKHKFKGKLPYVKGLPNSEYIDDVTDLLTIINNKDGTFDYDLTQTILNTVRNRYYGIYLNTGAATGSTSAAKVNLNVTDDENGMTNASGTVTFDHWGIYKITLTIQFTNNQNQDHEAKVWVKKNGSDLANSASIVTVPSNHGGIAGHYLFAVDYLIEFDEDETFELYWAASTTDVAIETIGATGSGFSVGPASPAVILNISKAR